MLKSIYLFSGILLIFGCAWQTGPPDEINPSDSQRMFHLSTSVFSLMEEVEFEPGDAFNAENIGTFTIDSFAEGKGTYVSGPVKLDIERGFVVSGNFKGEMKQLTGREEILYIQVDIWVENSSSEVIYFFTDSPQAAVSTGERVTPDPLFSNFADSEMPGGTMRKASLIFIPEHSRLDEIEFLRITWEAPFSEKNQKEAGSGMKALLYFE